MPEAKKKRSKKKWLSVVGAVLGLAVAAAEAGLLGREAALVSGRVLDAVDAVASQAEAAQTPFAL